MTVGVTMGSMFIPIPQLGPDRGVNIDIPLILCHPDTMLPIKDTGIKDGNQLPIFKCAETETPGGFPTEFWKFICPKLPELMKTTSRQGQVIQIPRFTDKTRLKITVELLDPGTPEDGDEEEKPPSRLLVP